MKLPRAAGWTILLALLVGLIAGFAWRRLSPPEPSRVGVAQKVSMAADPSRSAAQPGSTAEMLEPP
nr:phosphoethanolamine transferase CptA [Verrucomicrobiota bacterium]